MKTNAKEYLRDVGFKRIEKLPFAYQAIIQQFDLDKVIEKTERINVKQRRGFLIQVTDHRDRYEQRKRKAEVKGLGFY